MVLHSMSRVQRSSSRHKYFILFVPEVAEDRMMIGHTTVLPSVLFDIKYCAIPS